MKTKRLKIYSHTNVEFYQNESRYKKKDEGTLQRFKLDTHI